MSENDIYKIYRDSLITDRSLEGVFNPTQRLVELASEFALGKWRQRATENQRSTKQASQALDLSSACKFCSLFSWILFGGTIQGNWHHQFSLTTCGERIDLTHGARMFSDFSKDGIDPYLCDEDFILNDDHLESMESCLPRVALWAEEFIAKYDRQK